jgi:hypothetical protein
MLCIFFVGFDFWFFLPRFELPNQHVSPSFTTIKHSKRRSKYSYQLRRLSRAASLHKGCNVRKFSWFECFRGLLNVINSENSLLSRILLGLFPLMLCLLCEPICPVLIPAGMLQCSLISRVRKFIVSATVKQAETL